MLAIGTYEGMQVAIASFDAIQAFADDLLGGLHTGGTAAGMRGAKRPASILRPS